MLSVVIPTRDRREIGRTAEVIAQYVKKGRPIFVEGRIQTRSWDDKEGGKKNYRTEIIVENFQFGADAKGPGRAPLRGQGCVSIRCHGR